MVDCHEAATLAAEFVVEVYVERTIFPLLKDDGVANDAATHAANALNGETFHSPDGDVMPFKLHSENALLGQIQNARKVGGAEEKSFLICHAMKLADKSASVNTKRPPHFYI